MKRGISDGTNPTAPVTREQLAAMLYRFAGAPAVSGALNFNDANAVSEYARSALLWATQNGILNGVGGDLAAPAAPAERSGRDDAGALPAKRRLKQATRICLRKSTNRSCSQLRFVLLLVICRWYDMNVIAVRLQTRPRLTTFLLSIRSLLSA